jgi:hypothetical protein
MITSNGELATDAVATAMLVSPFWLPWLHATSAVFAICVPILGGIWLFIQIVRALILGIIWLKKQHK